MLITTKGIVIRERSSGENGKYIDILTEKLGLIEVLAKGSKKITSKSFSSSQLFAYSTFCLNEQKNKFYINTAVPVNIFYPIREDVEKLALAVYLCDLIRYASSDTNEAPELLKLILISLHNIAKNDADIDFIKSVFEFRFMSEIGFYPNLNGCCVCGNIQTENYRFSIANASLYCENCVYEENLKPVSSATLKAMRYVANCETEKLFSFKLKGESKKQFYIIAQQYVLTHMEAHFDSLDYYYKLKGQI